MAGPTASARAPVTPFPAAPARSDPAPSARNPMLSALLAQVLAAAIAGLCGALLVPSLLSQPLALAIGQGGCAALVSWRLGEPAWRWPLHAVFMPAAVVALALDLPVWIWPAGLLLLLLTYWRTDRSQVPLYLSNLDCRDALLGMLPAAPSRVLDLGCGDGALLRHLARARPDCHFVGIEHAPLPWLWAWLAARGYDNLEIRFGDFWKHRLTGYALVHAFLSPAAMSRLGAKAHQEMDPRARLLSNSFPVPEWPSLEVIDVGDRRRTKFHVYDPRAAGRP